ncbi:hypothetical protein ACHHYP_09928 [Achlya hypogyna]|uniref:Rubisco LSMT substrate-binding domain-containing protein n=1 Tax=Achlya hypogyna TaxID=1202772 RepID=A0A1V9YM82_ACHHY|nr:hypothetical protein ACHHYP_09928 [Achlya hypogyna]
MMGALRVFLVLTALAGLGHVGEAGLAVGRHGLIINPAKTVTIETNPVVDHFGDDDIIHSIGHLNNLKAKGSTFGRGPSYVAARNVSAGDPVLRLPMSSVMSARTAAAGRIQVLLDVNPDLPNAVVLALHVLEEKFKGPDSKWFSFIHSLPMTLHGTIYLPEDEIDLIEGSQLYRLTHARLNAVSQYFDALHGPVTSNAVDPPLFNVDEFTLEAFKWAMSIVWAHAILIPKDDDVEALLVPFVSTLAHGPGIQNHFDINFDTQTFTMLTATALQPGDPVRINLGDSSMALYMLNYGFCGEPSPLDNVPLTIQVEEKDPLRAFKTSILAMVNTTMEAPYVLEFDPALPPNVVQSMRIKVLELATVKLIVPQVMTSSEIGQYEAAINHERISLRNEFAWCRALTHTCAAMLDAYAYPLDEMKRMVPGLQGRQRDLARVVIHEQEILVRAKDAVATHWHGLLADESFVPE